MPARNTSRLAIGLFAGGVILFVVFLLLERRMTRAREEGRVLMNEQHAVEALECYVLAQHVFRQLDGSARRGQESRLFATSFTILGEPIAEVRAEGLIPAAMAAAVTTERGWLGYYFADLQGYDPWQGFGLFAIPCVYGETGRQTFFVSRKGDVVGKDLQGALPDLTRAVDGEWR